ncbi:hypothetical protein [Anaeromicrobium sediminis]|uniref:Uncharacterized protein n=1 Tax=Anaeromicrobium sediminis TaxID=1478221 RepID=A0A267MIQ2_9FIRM|nr:hypothetical protein [Anaeromicrobium sediminis]PAB59292.1 hypothetical protein CCE28_10530 [Anaeromicrobium sediminis]
MANTFDNKLPRTTTYWKEGEIFFIKHDSFRVSLEEGQAIAELLRFAMEDRSTKALLINNRQAKGAWSKEINELWEGGSENTANLPVKKMATLTNSVITTMQINRISKSNGIEKWSKAFNSEFNDEVKAFLLR